MKVVSTDRTRHVFNYDPENRVLVVSASGEMDNSTFHEVAMTLWDELDKHKCVRALIDYLEFTISDSIVELYDRPKELINVSGGRRLKMAGLVKEVDSNFRFIENIYVNRGFNVRIFTDQEEAMRWLTKDEEASVWLSGAP